MPSPHHRTRRTWKQDLEPYLAPDRRRSLGQIASVLLPYLGVWILAAVIRPGPWVSVALGALATVFLIRMYSLFHDLTHNSMFASRAANARWGHVLGYLLFTPFRWWQRQHARHHAGTGNLDARGPGEIYTMTVAEYGAAPWHRRLGYRAYRNPLVMMLLGPALVFAFERRFPQRGMSRRILVSVIATNVALAAWAAGWASLVGWTTYLLIQGTTLVAGGVIAAWLLYVQHQYEDTYYRSAQAWEFERAALQGSSYLQLPRVLAWVVGNANFHHVHHLSARIPNYRLREAHEHHPMFRDTPVVTVRTGIAALRLKLWDEERGSLVGFPSPSRRATVVAAAQARAASAGARAAAAQASAAAQVSAAAEATGIGRRGYGGTA